MPNKWSERVLRVQKIQQKLTGNTYFPTGWVASTLSQSQFGTDVSAFAGAEGNVVARQPGSTGQRDANYKTVRQDLDYIMTMVQAKADANPSNAVAIIESVGFFVRVTHGGQKRQNAAYNTQIPGTVMLTADGGGMHQWEMSKDQVNITTLPPTRKSKTMVPGLTPGDVWYFRNKKVDTAKKSYNWCAWIQLKINAGGRNLGGSNTEGTAGNLPTA